MNNMELYHGLENGNFLNQIRGMGKLSSDSSSYQTAVQGVERTLTAYYRTQLRLMLFSLLDLEGQFPSTWRVDWGEVETKLRQGLLVAVGMTSAGVIEVIRSDTQMENLGFGSMGIGFVDVDGKGGIKDPYDSEIILKPIRENNPSEGDYVVFSNKNLRYFFNYTNMKDEPTLYAGLSDMALLALTSEKMAINRATVLQNMLQMRSSQIFVTENQNVTSSKIAEGWMGGYPIMGVTDGFNVQDKFQSFSGGAELPTFVNALNDLWNVDLAEFGMWLGVSSAGIIKQSGASDLEVSSKLNMTQGLGEIYLKPRQRGCDLLCKRFGEEGDHVDVVYAQQGARMIQAMKDAEIANSNLAKFQAEFQELQLAIQKQQVEQAVEESEEK